MEQLKFDTENRIIANLKLLEEVKIIIDTISSNVKDNLIFDELLPSLKRRLNDVYDNVRNTKIPVKQNDSKRYDILTPDGRIQLGLRALNREQIHSMFDYEDNPAQILREIDEYNMIHYETDPVFLNEQFIFNNSNIINKEASVQNDESETSTNKDEVVQDELKKNLKNKKIKKLKKEQKNAKTTRKSHT